VVVIRSASAADAPQIAAVMRDSWLAAYQGIIPHHIIDQVTAPDGGARIRQSFRTRPWQRVITAVARDRRPSATAAGSTAAGSTAAGSTAAGSTAAGSTAAGIVGYASFGPECDVLGTSWPHPRTAAGAEGRVAELYALYVHPAWWSTGTGRALLDQVLAKVAAAGYRCITLWVLEDNARARRFYERAGFAPDDTSHGLPDLGGVTEIRYRRALRETPQAP
jgi:ribosomal protein S18 acetylase RimI-like enzyme